MTDPDRRGTLVEDLTVRLADGRKVAVATYGGDSGRPVFMLHGTPGCRLGLDVFDEPARTRGVRVVVPDRPGIGGSEPPLVASIASYTDDVAAIADELGMDRFGVIGYSSGGPFALACGARLDRVTSVATIGGVAPVGTERLRAEIDAESQRILGYLERGALRAARRRLWLIGALARHLPSVMLALFKRELGPADRAVLAGIDSSAMDGMAAAFQQGTAGVLNEYRVWLEPWGFDLSEVDVPVDIWQGEEDTFVGDAHPYALEGALPDARLHLLPDTGHISVLAHVGDVLDGLSDG